MDQSRTATGTGLALYYIASNIESENDEENDASTESIVWINQM
jgi:hypothetical protein